MDDSVEEPSGSPTWDREFDFGCNNKYVGRTYWKSATGHYIEMSDVEGKAGDENAKLRGEDNFIRIKSASGNKIDYFLHAKVDYSVVIERGAREVLATAKITVTNSSPSEGLPDYVIGNLVGLPRGSNRMLLSIHSRLGYVPSAVSDANVRWQFSTEQGHNVFSTYLDVAPGATREITLDLVGGLDLRAGYSLEVFNPPAVHPWSMNVRLSQYGSTATLVNSDRPGTRVFP
jgi:hypothetical protein